MDNIIEIEPKIKEKLMQDILSLAQAHQGKEGIINRMKFLMKNPQFNRELLVETLESEVSLFSDVRFFLIDTYDTLVSIQIKQANNNTHVDKILSGE